MKIFSIFILRAHTVIPSSTGNPPSPLRPAPSRSAFLLTTCRKPRPKTASPPPRKVPTSTIRLQKTAPKFASPPSHSGNKPRGATSRCVELARQHPRACSCRPPFPPAAVPVTYPSMPPSSTLNRRFHLLSLAALTTRCAPQYLLSTIALSMCPDHFSTTRSRAPSETDSAKISLPH